MAFVDRWPLFGASETTYPIFKGRIQTGLCGQETTTCICPYAQVWLYFNIQTVKVWLNNYLKINNKMYLLA